MIKGVRRMEKNTKSYLITDKEDFSQITVGKEMLARQITSHEALDTLKNDISKWSDYNKELLKQSFNNSDNEYLNEYKNIPIYGAFLGTHYLPKEVERYKKEISKYILSLEKIINKIDLIPTKGDV